MKAWRVMQNNRARGTDCFQDNLLTEKHAKAVCRKAKRDDPESSYFVQQYEEARVGRNVLSETST